MTLALYLIIYSAVLVFLAASIARAVRYAQLPMHLRWELYPVPHEEAALREHGGSYFEKSNWWEKPSRFDFWGELKVMLPEMLFLKGLWEFNRGLWFRSFPFHFGLYLLVATAGLLTVSALMGTAVLRPCYLAAGAGGTVLATAGALGLLSRRLTDPDLRNYTSPGDIFNLVFFIAVFGLLGAGYLTMDRGSPGILALVRGVLTFDLSVAVPPLLAAGLVLGAMLAAYIPMTHMSHFIAKYFTYHSIRWGDEPNRGQARMARKIAEHIAYRPTWAAPHVGADGVKTWGEIARSHPPAVKK